VKSICVEVDPEKKIARDDRKNVVMSETVAITMVKAEFKDWVGAMGPGERKRDLGKSDLNWFGDFLDHAFTI